MSLTVKKEKQKCSVLSEGTGTTGTLSHLAEEKQAADTDSWHVSTH